MSRQPSLFDDPPPPHARHGREPTPAIQPADPKVAAEEAPRLARQSRAVLELLMRGRATNTDILRIAQRVSGRIHDLREAGYDIRIVERDARSGLNTYQLFGGPGLVKAGDVFVWERGGQGG